MTYTVDLVVTQELIIMCQNYSQNVMDGIKETKQMNEDDKVLLYELNETYTDGFVRGYNRDFLMVYIC